MSVAWKASVHIVVFLSSLFLHGRSLWIRKKKSEIQKEIIENNKEQVKNVTKNNYDIYLQMCSVCKSSAAVTGLVVDNKKCETEE